MVNKKLKILAIIPARAGSKRLPGKNHKSLFGKPLVQWTIESAINSKYISHIVLTSNDHTILKIGDSFKQVSCLKRSDDLSDDNASSVAVAMDVLDFYPGFDFFILLQPTSPLRTEYHIDDALHSVLKNNARSCVSLCKSNKNPYLMYKVTQLGNIQPIINADNISSSRSQDLPISYILNGAIYINNVSNFILTKEFINKETIPYIMDSNSSIDIDTIEDFNLAEKIITENKNL